MTIYLLKSHLILIMLYGFYRLMMIRDTFFVYRRMALMGIVLLSVVLPAIQWPWLAGRGETMVAMAHTYAEVVVPVVHVYAPQSPPTWLDVLAWTYWLVVALLMGRLIWRLGRIVWVVRHTPFVRVDGVRVHRLPGGESPYSFFRDVFVSQDDGAFGTGREVMVHELAHARQLHSVDVLIAELVSIVGWCNPCCHLLRREVRLNLEYLADEAVLAEGFARKPYQYHLLAMATRPPRQGLTSHLNVLPLKNRIRMMNCKRTPNVRKAKYLLFVPLALGLLAVSHVEVIARELARRSATVAELSHGVGQVLGREVTPREPRAVVTVAPVSGPEEAKADTVPPRSEDGSRVFDLVETMPSFPGGMAELMRYLGSQIKYPAEVWKAGIQGRVVVTFVVEKDGQVSEPTVNRSVHPLLAAEALRVVRGMPRWTPGMRDGEPVRVRYTLPIMFSLGSHKKPSASPDAEKAETPLVYIDGVRRPLTDMDGIKKEMIESVSVLKGDEAVARFGEEARAGVILVVMKK